MRFTKICMVAALIVLSGMCFAIAPKFVGALGNSGTEKNPVMFGPYEYGDVTRSQTQAGPVFDEKSGLLYAAAGAERLNVYRLNGEMVASHKIPKGFFNVHSSSMLKTEKYLYFVRHFGHGRPGSLWRIALDAPNGSEAEKVNLPIKSIAFASKKAKDGEIALVGADENYTLYFWKEATGELREAGNLKGVKPFVLSVDWNSKGDLFAFSYFNVYKVVDGKVDGVEGYPKQYVAPRMLTPNNHFFMDGALWGVAGCSVLRFNEETFEPDPGVTFSGRGRVTLSYIFNDEDIGAAGGIASIGKNHYAVTGRYGSITIFKWDEGSRRCERVRRIGAIPETDCLVLSKDGVILAGNVGYLWDEGEDAVTHTSWLWRAEYGIRAGDGALRFSKPWRGEQRSVAYYGPFRECHSNRMRQSDNGRLGDFTKLIGAASFDGGVVCSMTSDGVCSRYKMSIVGNAFNFTREGDEKVVFAKETQEEYSAFESVSDDKCVLARNGIVILMKIDGETLREELRLRERFESDCKLSADGGIVAIPEKSKNRVSLYSTEGKKLSEINVRSPGRLSLCGFRLIIQDTASQRILKYEL